MEDASNNRIVPLEGVRSQRRPRSSGSGPIVPTDRLEYIADMLGQIKDLVPEGGHARLRELIAAAREEARRGLAAG